MLAQSGARSYPRWLLTAGRVVLFAGLLALSARITIELPGTPVPITAQTFAVLLTGMALGPVEGMTSVLAYLGAIALGLPLDARMLGPAAFASPTAGYLVGFIPGALIAGLAWRVNDNGWRKFALSLICGFAGVGVIFAVGVIGLLPFMGGSLPGALMAGAIPFIFVDFGKVLLAASLVKLGREAWARYVVKP